MVGDVLAQGERAVCVEAGQHFDAVVIFTHNLNALFEALGIFFGPPLHEVAVLVEFAALVVEAVCHFMADDNTDC